MARKQKASQTEPSVGRQRINQATSKLHQRWASYLGSKTAHWDAQSKILFLVAICLLMGGLSIYNLLRGLDPAPAPTRHIAPKETIAPAPLYLPRLAPQTHNDSLVLARFHHLVDSLRQTPEGTANLQKFLDKHPGLLDSIAYIEKTMP